MLIARYRLSVAYLMGPVGALDVDRPMVNAWLCPASWRSGSTDGVRRSSYPCRIRMLDDSGLYHRGREWACWSNDSHEISTPWHFIGAGVEQYQVPKELWQER
jgi:hypothetical protein